MKPLTHSQLIAAVLRGDLAAFIVKVFQTVSPGDRYVHGWHIDAIVYELLRALNGDTHRLLINQPPRSLKSICVSVAFVAWCLGHNPSLKFACASYSTELAATFARQFRAVVTSPWYRELFPQMRLAKDTESEAQTTQHGGRFTVPVGGSFTGRGADFIIIDDPMKADEAQSEKARQAVQEWFSGTVVSRLDDKESGSIIVVAQRLHEDDLAGYLLRTGGWMHLNLPSIAIEDEAIEIGPGIRSNRRQGEALHPGRESLARLEAIRSELGGLVFSAQYQQQPVPLEGNLVRRAWLQLYDQAPSRDPGLVFQSWDVATTTNTTSDYSVCTTWLLKGSAYYLVHVWRGKLEFPALVQKVTALAEEHNTRTVLIESAGIGQGLIQELRSRGRLAPIPIPVSLDKRMRMAAQSARFEAAQVYLPHEAPWLPDFLNEILAFPNSRHDDQVDSVSQALVWAEARRRPAFLGQLASGGVRIIQQRG